MKRRMSFLTAVIITMAFSALLAFAVTLPASASTATRAVTCLEAPVPAYGNGKVVVQKWEAAPAGEACLTVVWTRAGSVLMSGGVFTAPLTLNGAVLPTHVVVGQLAPQIVQFQRAVSAGERWVFRPTWLPTGTEITLGFDYIAPLPPVTPTPTMTPAPTWRLLWLPLIVMSPRPLEEIQQVTLSGELQVIYYKWGMAVRGQETCLKINFSGVDRDALIEGGWVFGSDLKSTLNGDAFMIPTFTRPDDTATQLGSVRLPAPQNLRVCVTGVGGGNEIGLRIRYPAP